MSTGSATRQSYIEYDLTREYPVAERGEGIYLYDVDGRRYIDGFAGNTCVTIGHGCSEVVAAIAEQAGKLAFVHRMGFATRPTLRLAERIAAVAPGDLDRVFLVSSGSEAVESALAIARKHAVDGGREARFKLISRWQSYHGQTLGALSATGHTARRKGYGPYLRADIHISPCYCYRCPYGDRHPDCGLKCALELERAIRQNNSESVLAFLCEPIVGAACGATVPPPGYFQAIRRICSEYGVLMIMDEVLTGFGRTGRRFAIEHWNVVPDMIVFGKGCTGGYTPLAGVVVRGELMETIRDTSGVFFHGHTFAGNPLSAATCDAVMDYVAEHDLIDRCAQMGDYLHARLLGLLDLPIVGDVRGRGLLAGIELVEDKPSKRPFPPEWHVAAQAVQACFDAGLCVYPGTGCVDGVAGDFIQIAPPFIVTREQVDAIVAILRRSLESLAGRLG